MKDIYQLRARDIMSNVVVHLNPDDTIHDALTIMGENRLSALPIVDKSMRCVGFLSAVDFIEMARETSDSLSDLGDVSDLSRQWLMEKLDQHDLGQKAVSTRMTGVVASVDSETPLVKVAAEMLRHRIHHLPVVGDQERMLGIISTVDLLAAFAEGAAEGAAEDEGGR